MPQIEFPSIVKKRSIDIRLHNISFVLPILVFILSNQFMNIFKGGQLDTPTLITILPRFDNPHLFRLTLILLHKPPILPILNRPNMISFRNILKRILSLNLPKIIIQ